MADIINIFEKLAEEKKNKPFIGPIGAGAIGGGIAGGATRYITKELVTPKLVNESFDVLTTTGKQQALHATKAKRLSKLPGRLGWLVGLPAGLLAFKMQRDSYK